MKEEREGRYAAMKKRNQIMNILSIIIGLVIFVGGAVGLFYFATYLKEV